MASTWLDNKDLASGCFVCITPMHESLYSIWNRIAHHCNFSSLTIFQNNVINVWHQEFINHVTSHVYDVSILWKWRQYMSEVTWQSRVHLLLHRLFILMKTFSQDPALSIDYRIVTTATNPETRCWMSRTENYTEQLSRTDISWILHQSNES